MFRNNGNWDPPDTMSSREKELFWKDRRKDFVKGWMRGKSRDNEKADGDTGEEKILSREPS